MRFGKICYLNLLPFDMFIKSYPTPSRFKQSLFAHSSYPAKLNQSFLFNRIDAGFISSIAGVSSHNKQCGKYATKSGIIAKGAVWSVLVKHSTPKNDYQSDTSNTLSKALGLKGEVIIGDKALLWLYQNKKTQSDFSKGKSKANYKDSHKKISHYRHRHTSEQGYIDMGEAWFSKQGLPFVFGRLCCAKKYATFYEQISNRFNAKFNPKRVKIPHFWLLERARQMGISLDFAKEYLAHIYYKIGAKESIAIARFYRLARLMRLSPPKRAYKTPKHPKYK